MDEIRVGLRCLGVVGILVRESWGREGDVGILGRVLG